MVLHSVVTYGWLIGDAWRWMFTRRVDSWLLTVDSVMTDDKGMHRSAFLWLGSLLLVAIGVASSCTLNSSGTKEVTSTTSTTGTGGSAVSSSTTSTGTNGGGGSSVSSSGVGGMAGQGGAMPACGDGVVNPGEECDDGNAMDNDGCSAGCTYDLSDGCPMVVVPVGTTPRMFTGNTMQASPTAGSACGGNSAGDYIVQVTATVDGALMVTLDGQYNSVVWLKSQCPTGNQSLACDGGSNGVPAVVNYPVTVGSTYYVGVDGLSSAEGPFTLTMVVNQIVCGDGMISPGAEQCDDGNTDSGDGCSSVCLYEPTLNGCPNAALSLGSTLLTFMGDTSNAADTSDATCGGNNEEDYVFRIVPVADGTLVATLSPTFNNSVLWLRDSCVGGNELGCQIGNAPVTLSQPVTMGTTYYLGVDGTGNQSGTFTLSLQLQ